MKNNKQKKLISLIALFICIIFILTTIAPVMVNVFATNSDSEITAKKDDLEKLAKQKQQLEKEIKIIQSDKSLQMKYKDNLDQQISVTQNQIGALNSMIKSLEARSAQTQNEINSLNLQMKTQISNFKSRMRAIHETGDSSYIEVLLSSGSYSAFLSRMDIVTSIIERDNKAIEQLKQTGEKLKKAKEEIEKNMAEQTSAKKDIETKNIELSSKRSESQAIINKLNQDESYCKTQFEIAEREERRIQQEIANLINPSEAYVGGTFAWPCPGHTQITSPFGWRLHPTLKVNKLHTGTDIGAPTGAKIVAANDGKVIKVEYNTAYGNMVVIDHGGNTATLYAHMSSFNTSVGATVKRGSTIGYVGSTGYSTGPHLHFEIIKNGQPVNPMDYLN